MDQHTPPIKVIASLLTKRGCRVRVWKHRGDMMAFSVLAPDGYSWGTTHNITGVLPPNSWLFQQLMEREPIKCFKRCFMCSSYREQGLRGEKSTGKIEKPLLKTEYRHEHLLKGIRKSMAMGLGGGYKLKLGLVAGGSYYLDIYTPAGYVFSTGRAMRTLRVGDNELLRFNRFIADYSGILRIWRIK